MSRSAGPRLNVGCGEFPLAGWLNLDADPAMPAELHARVPPLPFADGELSEIYAGHFLEHLTLAEATAFLAECGRTLPPGGRLGIVVPDTFEIARRYVLGLPDRVEYPAGVWRPVADLRTVCDLFLYSTAQDSPHRWSWDAPTLARAMTAAGFIGLRQIDRYADPRIPVGAWYQCGLDGWRSWGVAGVGAREVVEL